MHCIRIIIESYWTDFRRVCSTVRISRLFCRVIYTGDDGNFQVTRAWKDFGDETVGERLTYETVYY